MISSLRSWLGDRWFDYRSAKRANVKRLPEPKRNLFQIVCSLQGFSYLLAIVVVGILIRSLYIHAWLDAAGMTLLAASFVSDIWVEFRESKADEFGVRRTAQA